MALSISASLIAGLARLDLGDTQHSDDVDFGLTLQPGYEASIQPEHLVDSAVIPLLVLNIGKLIAADVLSLRRREEGAAAAFQGAGLLLSAEPDHGPQLRAEADAALAPYRIGAATGEQLTAAQIDKITAEITKIEAEALRVEAETLRVAADQARIAAETARLEAEALRLEAEALRLAAATAKLGAEEDLVTARVGRVADERTLLQEQAEAVTRRSLAAARGAGLMTQAEARAALGLSGVGEAARHSITPSEESSASRARQDRMFGRSEGSRNAGSED